MGLFPLARETGLPISVVASTRPARRRLRSLLSIRRGEGSHTGRQAKSPSASLSPFCRAARTPLRECRFGDGCPLDACVARVVSWRRGRSPSSSAAVAWNGRLKPSILGRRERCLSDLSGSGARRALFPESEALPRQSPSCRQVASGRTPLVGYDAGRGCFVRWQPKFLRFLYQAVAPALVWAVGWMTGSTRSKTASSGSSARTCWRSASCFLVGGEGLYRLPGFRG
jgi:hypothetical protein